MFLRAHGVLLGCVGVAPLEGSRRGGGRAEVNAQSAVNLAQHSHLVLAHAGQCGGGRGLACCDTAISAHLAWERRGEEREREGERGREGEREREEVEEKGW